MRVCIRAYVSLCVCACFVVQSIVMVHVTASGGKSIVFTAFTILFHNGSRDLRIVAVVNGALICCSTETLPLPSFYKRLVLPCLVIILANTPMESNGQGWVRMLFSHVCLGLSEQRAEIKMIPYLKIP